jgi:hypothetical protein
MKRDIDTHSESWRAECEARYYAAMSPKCRDSYIALVRNARGDVAADRLLKDAEEIWRK